MKIIDKIIDILIKNIKKPIIITNYPDDSFFTSLKEIADNAGLEYIEVNTHQFNDRVDFLTTLYGMPMIGETGKVLAKSKLVEGETKLINFHVKQSCEYTNELVPFIFENDRHIICLTLQESKDESLMEPEYIFDNVVLNRSLLFDYKKLND
jgi:hypothetical protein